MNKDQVLNEALRLHALGFGIHWLHPKSKRPIGNGWTSGPRKTWQALRDSYHEGQNVGVRLGTPSKIHGGYLAVIDVDLKSKDEKHVKEVLKKLKEMGPVQELPTVKSGRGNGSRHYYILTPEPIAPFKAFQSPSIVKVSMPSAKPSKRELEELSKEELSAGLRLRNAWEIAFMGEGQQVVLPPSVHPDSGKGYEWLRDFHWSAANKFNFDAFKQTMPAQNVDKSVGNVDNFIVDTTIKKPGPKALDFKPVNILVKDLKVSDSIKKMIAHGTGVEDRSAALLPICSQLVRANHSVDEILSVLTNRKYFLSNVGYEHAQTKNQEKAAAWIYKYTLKRVLDENDAEILFRDEPKESKPKTIEELTQDQADFDLLMSDAKLSGFYRIGDKGALHPDYNALLDHFKKQHDFKMIADMRTVYTFNGTHYVPVTPVQVKGFAEDNFVPPPAEKIRLEFLHKVWANNIELRSFFTNTTEGKINFKNGVLTLDDGFPEPALEPHSPDYGFRAVLPYDFDAKAQCPFFMDWIESIMLGDSDLVCLLQEFMGYIVRGGPYKYHKALWLGGVGRNGKSTFVDLLKALIGSNNFSTISIKSLMNDKFAGADLDGKLANFSEETSPQELADSGPFKNLTGDGEIFAQKKYGDPYSFRNRAKLIMTYNTIPDLKDLSAGMLSRPIIIPFEKIIADNEQDRDIKKKLFKELPGIFNFALAGWDRLELQNDFTKSARSTKALKKVKEESCSVFQWVQEHVQFNDKPSHVDPLLPRILYAAYCQVERYPFKAVEFYRRLNNHPQMAVRKYRNKQGFRYFGLEVL